MLSVDWWKLQKRGGAGGSRAVGGAGGANITNGMEWTCVEACPLLVYAIVCWVKHTHFSLCITSHLTYRFGSALAARSRLHVGMSPANAVPIKAVALSFARWILASAPCSNNFESIAVCPETAAALYIYLKNKIFTFCKQIICEVRAPSRARRRTERWI